MIQEMFDEDIDFNVMHVPYQVAVMTTTKMMLSDLGQNGMVIRIMNSDGDVVEQKENVKYFRTPQSMYQFVVENIPYWIETYGEYRGFIFTAYTEDDMIVISAVKSKELSIMEE